MPRLHGPRGLLHGLGAPQPAEQALVVADDQRAGVLIFDSPEAGDQGLGPRRHHRPPQAVHPLTWQHVAPPPEIGYPSGPGMRASPTAPVILPRLARDPVAPVVSDEHIDPDACGLPLGVAVRAFAPLVALLLSRGRPPYAPALVRAAAERALAGRHVLLRRAGRDGLPLALRPLLLPAAQEGAVRLHPRVATLCADGAAMDAVVVRGLYGRQANAEAGRLAPWHVQSLHPAPPLETRLDPRARVGLLLLTTAGAERPGAFASCDELLAAWEHGAVPHDALVIVRVGGQRRATTAGRALLWRELSCRVPFESVDRALCEAAAWRLAGELARDPSARARWAACAELERIGLAWASRTGCSLGMADLRPETPPLDAACAADLARLAACHAEGEITDGERYNRLVDTWALELERRGLRFGSGPPQGALGLLLLTRVLPRPADARALIDSVGLIARRDGSLPERPVLGAPARGLDPHDMMLLATARRGAALHRFARGQQVRSVLLSAVRRLRGLRVITKDCGAPGPVRITALIHEGVVLRTVADRARGRVLAADALDEQGAPVLPAGTLLGAAACALLRSRQVPAVRVRSPRTCAAAGGVCALCYGADHQGDDETLAPVGAAVGLRGALTLALAARALPQGPSCHIC